MMTRRPLTQELAPVAQRVRRLWLLRAWAWCWLAAAVAGFGCWVAAQQSGWWFSQTVAVLGGLAGFAAMVLFVVSRRIGRQTLDLARQIEHRYPDLDEKLLAAVEQERMAEVSQLGYLQQLVIAQARIHSRQHDWQQAIPTRELMGARAAHLMSFVLLAAVLTYLTGFTPPIPPVAEPAVEVEPVIAGQYDVAVEPGDTSVERGTGLLVMARFNGMLPAEVTVVYGPSSESTQRLRMSKSLDDPVFGVRVPSVQADLTYHVEFAEQRTKAYSVNVFEFPRLVRADARLVLPEYTGVPERIVEDTRHVSAVQGTKLTWLCHLNKPVMSAQLVAEDDSALNLAPADDGTNVYRTTLTITRSQRFRLHLTDADGRANKEPPELVVDRLENRPPELKLAFPARDMQVSPLQELVLEASVTDDYGLRASGLTYTLADNDPETVVLTGQAAANEKRTLGHLLSLETLEAKPDQLVSYYFWAEDLGPDGQVRRTMGDMFFAEVQPFEEIFRKGQQEAGGGPKKGGQQGGPAGDPARLQKQIINATWNLIRREVGAEPSAKFNDDVDAIRESQQEVLIKVEELKSKARDLQRAGKVDAVARHMKKAIESLADAADTHSADPLMDALGPERKAYQALLAMRSHEHRVSRGQRGGGGGGGGNRSQQQLQQLELSNKENRYETRSQANAQGNQAQREQSRALNRLSELARRQGDLNDRLKELQAALQEARTEQEKEELRRRLKRLREEEQEILRDLDEMRNRMDQPENRSRMADARQQLEQTRSNVRRASKALEEGMVSRALTSGTRAQREMQNLRDEFRKKMAGEFGETMQEMRQDARDLAHQQHELGEKLESMDKAKHRTLRSSPERQDVQEGLERQKEELAELLDRMREVTQQAETSEPLLSKQLYDTFRRASQKNIDKDLDLASNLFRRGFISEASKVEPRARKGIDALKEGVERAAESVLGDELEALRRARRDVQELAERARRELEQKDPSQRRAGGQGASKPTTQPGDPSQQRDGSRTGETRVASREATSQPASGQPPGQGSSPQSGQQPGSRRSGGRQRLALRGSGQQQGGNRRGGPGGQSGGGWRQFLGGNEWGGGPGGPLTGAGFRDWADRLRDVERMLDDPELRGDAARIREQARTLRAEFKRHSKEPNWDIVRVEIVEPLVELQSRIGEELARKASPESLVPIDRDPVPPRFASDVRRYYERLGSGK